MDIYKDDIIQTDKEISVSIADVNKDGEVYLSENIDITDNSLSIDACEKVADITLNKDLDNNKEISDDLEF